MGHFVRLGLWPTTDEGLYMIPPPKHILVIWHLTPSCISGPPTSATVNTHSPPFFNF